MQMTYTCQGIIACVKYTSDNKACPTVMAGDDCDLSRGWSAISLPTSMIVGKRVDYPSNMLGLPL